MISVFGATGFIGTEFCRQFANRFVQIKENPIPHTNEILFLISTVDNYNVLTDPYVDIYTNEIMTIKVLEEARKKFGNDFTFNFVSTWFVYGDTVLPARENFVGHPKGFYSITKLAGEQLVSSYCETFGARYRILRLGSVLGVGDKKASLYKNAIQFLISEIAQNKKVEIYKDPSYRDIIDVRDCVKAIEMVLHSNKYNEIINIGNGEAVNVRALLDKVAKDLGKKRNVSYIEVPEFHKQVQSKEFVMDISKIVGMGYWRMYELDKTVDWIISQYE